jgi:hypothetical protein
MPKPGQPSLPKSIAQCVVALALMAALLGSAHHALMTGMISTGSRSGWPRYHVGKADDPVLFYMLLALWVGLGLGLAGAAFLDLSRTLRRT